jgi:hypothetical protein
MLVCLPLTADRPCSHQRQHIMYHASPHTPTFCQNTKRAECHPQIAFSSPEAAPHTLLLYHAASNTHTFKLLGPAVHLQPHMCEGVLLTINIGAAVTVQRYVKLELHGHVVQPGAGGWGPACLPKTYTFLWLYRCYAGTFLAVRAP